MNYNLRTSNNLKILIGTLSLIISIFASSSASALTISPAKDSIKLKPGVEESSSFKVINDGKKDIKVKFYTTPYSVVDTDYTPNYETKKNFNKLSSWIKISQKTATVKVGETKIINYRVLSPNKIPNGNQYAIIMTEVVNDEQTNDGTGIKTIARVAMPVYGKSKQKTKLSGKISKIVADFFQTDKNLDIKSFIKNTGNTEFEAKTEVSLKDLFGNTKSKQDTTSTILPYSTRKISYNNEKSAPIGLFKLEIKNSFLGNKNKHTQYILCMSPILIAVFILLVIGLISGLIILIKK